MAEENRSFSNSLGASRAHVVARKLFDHRTAHHPSKDRRERRAQSCGGQNQAADSPASRHWQPANLDGKNKNQDRAEREIGNGEAQQSEDRSRAIRGASPSTSGEDTSGNSDGDAHEQRGDRQLQRRRKSLQDNRSDRRRKTQRASPIAACEALKITRVLHAQRLVQPESMTQLRDVLGPRVLAEHLLDGIARNDVNQEKNHRKDQPKRK